MCADVCCDLRDTGRVRDEGGGRRGVDCMSGSLKAWASTDVRGPLAALRLWAHSVTRKLPKHSHVAENGSQCALRVGHQINVHWQLASLPTCLPGGSAVQKTRPLATESFGGLSKADGGPCTILDPVLNQTS